MLSLWATVSFATWLNAVLVNAVDPDTAADAIGSCGDGVPRFHRVAGLEGFDDPVSLPVALNLLRRRGATQASVALPTPGDPLGLAGPPAFNVAAIAAGQAVVVSGAEVGLIPTASGIADGGSVLWWAHRANPPRTTVDTGQADRDLRQVVLDAANRLANLAAPGAIADNDVADLLNPEQLRVTTVGVSAGTLQLPPRLPSTATGLLDRACRMVWATQAGRLTDGSALTAHDADSRHDVLTRLNRVARTAVVAAASARIR